MKGGRTVSSCGREPAAGSDKLREGGILSSSPSSLPPAEAVADVGAVESFLEGFSSDASPKARSFGASAGGAAPSRSAMGTRLALCRKKGQHE